MALPKAKLPPPDPQHSAEELADAIVQVASASKRLLSSRLSLSAVVLLIHDSIRPKDRPTRDQIRAVLTGAADLEKNYLRRR